MTDERWDYVVVTQDEKPLGIITERDIPRLLRDGAFGGLKPSSRSASFSILCTTARYCPFWQFFF